EPLCSVSFAERKAFPETFFAMEGFVFGWNAVYQDDIDSNYLDRRAAAFLRIMRDNQISYA
ncbi:MAG: hypothetical protein VXX91_07390, partial [Planctomycetota bacterium]|nr:hypothetical protein [Planctomycetota bacterium]